MRVLVLLSIVVSTLTSVVVAFQVPMPTSYGRYSVQQQQQRQRESIIKTNMNADSWNAPATGGGAIETIEFKIYPDGRVEETVRGVKGNNCHKITEKINEALGAVIASTPTEEMFEQPVQVTETINLSNGWESSSTW